MDKREKEETRTAYVRDICKIVKDESVDLWVSCSGVASAVEDAMVKEVLGKMSSKGERRWTSSGLESDGELQGQRPGPV